MKKIYIILISLSLFILSACGQDLEDIKKAEFLSLPKKAQKYITNINNIIEKIVNYDFNDINNKIYNYNLKNIETSKYIFLGENHIDPEGILLNMAILNKYFMPGDHILVEGGDPWEKLNCYQYSGTIKMIYLGKKWSKKHKPNEYTGSSLPMVEMELDRKFSSIMSLQQIKKMDEHIKWDLLNFSSNECTTWDNIDKKNEIIERNKQMVEVMKEYGKNSGKIFIKTGSGHIPERYMWHINQSQRKNNKTKLYDNFQEMNNDLSIFYDSILKERIRSLQPIANFLSDGKKPYAVIIPKSVDPDLLPYYPN